MSHYQNIAKACVWVTLLMVFDLGSAGAATWSMQPLIAKGCQSYKDFPQVKSAIQEEAALNKLGQMTMKNLDNANSLGGAASGSSPGQKSSLCKSAKASLDGVRNELEPADESFRKARQGIRLLNADQEDSCSKVLGSEERNVKNLYYGLQDKVAADCPGSGARGGGYGGPRISPPTP